MQHESEYSVVWGDGVEAGCVAPQNKPMNFEGWRKFHGSAATVSPSIPQQSGGSSGNSSGLSSYLWVEDEEEEKAPVAARPIGKQ